jgi:hypothetical protein
MLLRHPGAVRLRQLVPLAFVTTLVILSLASVWLPAARTGLAALLLVYAVAILGSGFLVARRAGDFQLWLPVGAAFVIIHLAWGLGGLTHLLTFGRWPPWRLPPSVQRA